MLQTPHQRTSRHPAREREREHEVGHGSARAVGGVVAGAAGVCGVEDCGDLERGREREGH